jgi:ADP-ribosylglycohydrolase
MLDARELWHGCMDPHAAEGTKAGRNRSDDEEDPMMTTRPTTLNAAQSDRAAGVLFGHACGDALSAGYEFGPPIPADVAVSMIGGGTFGWAPGEWTDDTQMAVPILEAAEKAVAGGGELLDHLDDVAVAWAEWARHAADVGNQTRSVLSDFRAAGATTASALLECSFHYHERTGHAAGNGSLMRTSPVALSYLGDEDRIAAAALAVSNLTHYDDDAGDACVLWCLAINHAVMTGKLDVGRGLRFIPEARRELWELRCFEAVCREPVEFDRNGWVVHALQAAWCVIVSTEPVALDLTAGTHPAQHFQVALENAVRLGGDTDTVAAIAGQLLGALWGRSAVPAEWVRIVHGAPGLSAAELADRGLTVAQAATDRRERRATGRPDATH